MKEDPLVSAVRPSSVPAKENRFEHEDEDEGRGRGNEGSESKCWKEIGLWGDKSCPELKKVSHCRNCPVYSAAGIRMLDRPLTPGYLEEWTELLARPKAPRVTGTKSVVIFRLGAEWFGLPIQVFQEVAERRPRHSLPHCDNKLLLGLVNIRGELLLCVSLADLLGLESDAVAARQEVKGAGQHSVYGRLVVVAREGHRLAFPVDEIYGIYRYHPTELKETPATVSQSASKYSLGVFSWQQKTVGCLDDELVFHSLNRSFA